MIILSAKTHQQNWYANTDLHDDTLIAVSDTGYANDELSFEWLRHFDRHSAQRTQGAYRLLILDGYGSHCTYHFLQYCEQKKILPFTLLPHTTHLCQPLDVVLFQPYKHWHAEAVDNATRTGCEKLHQGGVSGCVDIHPTPNIYTIFYQIGLSTH